MYRRLLRFSLLAVLVLLAVSPVFAIQIMEFKSDSGSTIRLHGCEKYDFKVFVTGSNGKTLVGFAKWTRVQAPKAFYYYFEDGPEGVYEAQFIDNNRIQVVGPNVHYIWTFSRWISK